MIQEHYHYHDDLLTSVQQQQFEYLNVIHLFTFFLQIKKKRSFLFVLPFDFNQVVFPLKKNRFNFPSKGFKQSNRLIDNVFV